ncbi:MerR family transcriptional regulator [Desmospora profundinema]|uniref:DNA-binding transcriptional MerR regulator n=1 Tax=Desmospora profundinema TaxID=1571184 RepID=A0ABU1IN70_9BACL|nr:MerR family transcriptional regulator [Desmospora profundinema]MDR6226234.1 DNA-binding transcriptional MerR regulator [Desmospora profundinema]
MAEQAYITTREAAERLHVHARTVRKWIDAFEEYISPDVNDRGHYMLTEESFRRLENIQERLQETNKSMRQIRQDLMKEGEWEVERISEDSPPQEEEALSPALPFNQEVPVHRIVGSLDEIGEMMETVFTRLDQLEDHVFTMFDVMEEMERTVAAAQVKQQHNMVPVTTVQNMIDEIGKKHDQLKMELRNATFSHRLASATSESQMTPRRQKKARFLGIF